MVRRCLYNVAVKQRGFTLVEVLIALAILALVITTSLAFFYERRLRLRDANETLIAWQALANEAEALRHTNFNSIGASQAFTTDTPLLDELDGVETIRVVEVVRPQLKVVTLTVRWRKGAREVAMPVVRSHTGGGALW